MCVLGNSEFRRPQGSSCTKGGGWTGNAAWLWFGCLCVGVRRGQAWVPPRHEHFWRSVRGETATELISPTVGGASLPMINHASTTPAADVCSEDPWAPGTCRGVMDDCSPPTHLPPVPASCRHSGRPLGVEERAEQARHCDSLLKVTFQTSYNC